MIDFDNPASFPNEIRHWVLSNSDHFMSILGKTGANSSNQLKSRLQDMRLGDYPFIRQFVAANGDIELAVWHATRIEDIESFTRDGITLAGHDTAYEERLINLFHRIGLSEAQINAVLCHMNYYWDRDTERVEMVHFFADRQFVYEDDQLNAFALNLGGECVRWAIQNISPDLYRSEPYKRLWIWGSPSIIQFKCKLEDLPSYIRGNIPAEIASYFVATEVFDLPYEFRFTGKKCGSVLPQDIIQIEEISNFIKMQEQYSEFKDFYNT